MENLNPLDRGQQISAATVGAKFKTIRFDLSTARSRYDQDTSANSFGSGIKSFWVSNTNNRDFIATIVPNFRQDRKQNSGLPLRFNMNQKFQAPVNDACLEFAAQADVWIEITFSESEDISIGNTDIELSGEVAENQGATIADAKASVTTTKTLILAADDTRIVAYLQWKSGGDVYVGSSAGVDDADYQNICELWPAGSLVEYRGKGALYGKAATGTVVYQKRTHTA